MMACCTSSGRAWFVSYNGKSPGFPKPEKGEWFPPTSGGRPPNTLDTYLTDWTSFFRKYILNKQLTKKTPHQVGGHYSPFPRDGGQKAQQGRLKVPAIKPFLCEKNLIRCGVQKTPFQGERTMQLWKTPVEYYNRKSRKESTAIVILCGLGMLVCILLAWLL
jgi:hypothetical protein